jgi:hypothetical protein
MTKYKIQIGLETDLGLFELADKLRSFFKPELGEAKTFKEYISARMVQYQELDESDPYELVGKNNSSGYRFYIHDKKDESK